MPGCQVFFDVIMKKIPHTICSLYLLKCDLICKNPEQSILHLQMFSHCVLGALSLVILQYEAE